MQDYVQKITELKNHELVHDILPQNDKEEHLKLLQELKDLSIKCFDFCSDKLPTPPVHDDEPIPSTSGSNNIVNTNTTFDDDEDFGTQNRDYLHSEINVELIDSIESSVSSDILPDLEDLKSETSDNAIGVTTFRALNANERQKRKRRSRRGKFEPDEEETNCTDSDQ